MTELKRSPLHEEHVLLEASLVPFAGWEMPIQYPAGIVDEHKATRESVGIFDVSHMATFRLFGSDAEVFLSEMLTNDISKISEIGQAQYTLMLNEDGGIIDDLIVYRTGDYEFMIVANAGNHEKDFAWLKDHLPSTCDEGKMPLELVDESERTALIAVQGPEAIRIIEELADETFELPGRFKLASGLIDTVPALVARTGYTGEDGVELIVPAVYARQLWRALLSFEEVSPVGLGARDTLRLEMGFSLYGSDIDETTDPISAGLGWVVRKEGDYIGSKSVEKIRAEKPTRKLAFLQLAEGAGLPREGYSILHNGEEVGKVASGSFSPVLQTGIASGYLPVELVEPGQKLQVQIRKRVADAVVIKPPFIEK